LVEHTEQIGRGKRKEVSSVFNAQCIPESFAFYYRQNAVFDRYGCLLDLIFCNNPNLKVECSLEPLVSADKFQPALNIELPNYQSAPCCVRDQTYFNFRKVDYSKICSFISLFDWSLSFS